MSTLSPFQILPAHIVKIIVDHVSGSSRHEFDGIEKGSYGYQKLQVPLLHVCRNFRAIVSSNFCSICRISLSTLPLGIRIRWNAWPPQSLHRPDTSLFHLPKKIDLTLDMNNICTGKALESLSRIAYKKGAFPRVRLLRFQFEPSMGWLDEIVSTPEATSANIRDFVQLIRKMAPETNEIMVVTKFGVNGMPQCLQHHFSDLLIQLYQTVDHVIHQYHGHLEFSESQLASVHNLTFLNYFVKDDSAYFLNMARKSAPTLQLLSMKSILDFDLTSLIQDDNGDYVCYPCLQTLWHVTWGHVDISRLPAFPGAVPFPNLMSLTFRGGYAFADDTPFRGNAGTLMNIGITLNRPVVDMLRRYNVFTPDSHPRLQNVKTELVDSLVPECFATASNYVQFALAIAPHALARMIDVPDKVSILGEQEIFLICDLTSIQVLSLPVSHLKIWEVVVLVRSLPLLSDLYTSYPKLGPIPAGVTLADLPDYAISKFAPMGKRFRCWHLDDDNETNVSKEVVDCVILMTLVCPNFDYAALANNRREEFMALL
ncbi:hypothetical protein FBU31_004716, partial [Coemansia sp. 'formosensis']